MYNKLKIQGTWVGSDFPWLNKFGSNHSCELEREENKGPFFLLQECFLIL